MSPRHPTVLDALDLWIGHGAIVLPARSVGDGAVIAAGAVVTEDLPPYTVIAGNPARSDRQRFSADVAQRMQALACWDWPHDRLRAALPDFRVLSAEAFLDSYQRSCKRTPSEPTPVA